MENKNILVIRDKANYSRKIIVYYDTIYDKDLINYTSLVNKVYYNYDSYNINDIRFILLENSDSCKKLNFSDGVYIDIDIKCSDYIPFQIQNVDFIWYKANIISRIYMFFDNLVYGIKFCWGIF